MPPNEASRWNALSAAAAVSRLIYFRSLRLAGNILLSPDHSLYRLRHLEGGSEALMGSEPLMDRCRHDIVCAGSVENLVGIVFEKQSIQGR